MRVPVCHSIFIQLSLHPHHSFFLPYPSLKSMVLVTFLSPEVVVPSLATWTLCLALLLDQCHDLELYMGPKPCAVAHILLYMLFTPISHSAHWCMAVLLFILSPDVMALPSILLTMRALAAEFTLWPQAKSSQSLVQAVTSVYVNVGNYMNLFSLFIESILSWDSLSIVVEWAPYW